uniref:NYN domain-containing protein n=1 Tax=Microtetraspora niveoalba TaxID=46175 RepID=UPI00278C8DD1|nr:NYN domain-containing protein [Microtetraspora niveoalba]
MFVDAGYLLADGALAAHGTRHRESVSWDYPGLLQLLTGLSKDRTGLPLLRCYWYEATVEGRRTNDHDVLADIPGLKLRLARMRPGRREGVDAQVHRDLMTLARNNAVCDAVVVSGDEDLAQVVSDAQDLGIRVTVVHIAVEGGWAISRALRQECDDLIEIGGAQLMPYATPNAGADAAPAQANGQQPALNGQSRHNGSGQLAGAATGNGALSGSANGAFALGGGLNGASGGGVPTAGAPGTAASGVGASGVGAPGADASGSGPSGAGASGTGFSPGGASGGGSVTPASSPAPFSSPFSGAAHARPAQPALPAYSAYPVEPQPGQLPAPSPIPAPATSPASSPGTSQTPPQVQSPAPGSPPASPPAHGSSPVQISSLAPISPPPLPAPLSPPPGQVSPIPGVSPAQSHQSESSGNYSGASAGAYPAPGPMPLGPYTGPQPTQSPSHSAGPTTTLAESVQSAHKEGFDFGESVARDAPVLWLEAVLARKPRMPSDLEARLLQGSSLPIDFLLHEEVRQALRRGFWDALERARR